MEIGRAFCVRVRQERNATSSRRRHWLRTTLTWTRFAIAATAAFLHSCTSTELVAMSACMPLLTIMSGTRAPEIRLRWQSVMQQHSSTLGLVAWWFESCATMFVTSASNMALRTSGLSAHARLTSVAAQYVASFGSLELDDAMSVSVISVMAWRARESKSAQQKRRARGGHDGAARRRRGGGAALAAR